MLDGMPWRTPSLRPGVIRLALALAFTALLAAGAPWHEVFLPDDEGFELMKAWLLQRGHRLYGEIWCDQPPLHTLLLSAAFHLFGATIATGRALALAFAALCFWALSELVGRRHGNLAAALTLLGLTLAPGFARMATSATIMLPALAVALLAVVLIEPAQGRTNRRWLALAGAVFGLAMQIKFIAVIVLPLAVWELTWTGNEVVGWRLAARRLWVWSAGAATVFLGGLLAFPEATADALWAPHLSAGTRAVFAGGGPRMHALLQADAALLAVAAAGLLLAAVRRQTMLVPPLLLLAVAYAGHLWLRPFWSYYYLHLALPLAWLAAVAVRDLTVWVAEAGTGRGLGLRFVLVAGLFTPVLAQLPERVEQVRAALRPGDGIARQMLADRIRQHAGAWVFTDQPALAFQAGVPVPPEAVVLSQKRVRLGLFTERDLIRCLERRQPGVVALGAGLPVGEAARAYLAAHYQPPSLQAGLIVHVRKESGGLRHDGGAAIPHAK